MQNNSQKQANGGAAGIWKQISSRAEFSVLLGMIILIIGMSIASPVFMTMTNILNVLSQISRYGIISVGMALIIITGGIDLSIGYAIGLVILFAVTIDRVRSNGRR